MGCTSSKSVQTTEIAKTEAKTEDPDSREVLSRETNCTYSRNKLNSELIPNDLTDVDLIIPAVSKAEVDALRELYSKLSNELHHDGLIHKDELAWALFKAHRDNLFIDRVFDLFDIKRNNVIEFGEFVRSLSVFHPNAPLSDKASCRHHILILELFSFTKLIFIIPGHHRSVRKLSCSCFQNL